ncbi:CDP-glycerol glycerophosphotransferase family protein [Candidatus Saccharibacteria bacterium]|nr:CDP-glycerol glycerophosphotransferase family protein [Candidatus Saccharibacteria bacterium]
MLVKIVKNKLRNNKKLFYVLSRIKFWVSSAIYYLFIKLFRLFPICKNKIIFISFVGKGYGDNAKYIMDELLKKKDMIIYCAVKKNLKKGLPEGVKYTRYKSLAYYYHLATAKIWINNMRFDYGIVKRKNQFYIQTWHSSLRLKKIEKDALKHMTPQYITTCKHDSGMIDLITSGCRFSTDIYKKSFWYDGEVLECGTARCDILLKKDGIRKNRIKICDFFNIDPTKVIILYAPTFRVDGKFDDRFIDCDEFSKKMGSNYTLILRLHPNMNDTKINSNIINSSKYPDMQELICAADYLITDYSGCCFDMMIAKKPCILYVPDLEQYLKNERDLYFSFDELPFKKTSNIDELINTIKGFDYKEYLKNIQVFSEKIGLCERGNASKTIAGLIVDKCRGKNE